MAGSAIAYEVEIRQPLQQTKLRRQPDNNHAGRPRSPAEQARRKHHTRARLDLIAAAKAPREYQRAGFQDRIGRAESSSRAAPRSTVSSPARSHVRPPAFTFVFDVLQCRHLGAGVMARSPPRPLPGRLVPRGSPGHVRRRSHTERRGGRSRERLANALHAHGAAGQLSISSQRLLLALEAAKYPPGWPAGRPFDCARAIGPQGIRRLVTHSSRGCVRADGGGRNSPMFVQGTRRL